MKFNTEAIRKMAEIMVGEMKPLGLEEEGIRGVEIEMREFLRELPRSVTWAAGMNWNSMCGAPSNAAISPAAHVSCGQVFFDSGIRC